MRAALVMIFSGIGYLLKFIGGFVSVGMFFYGIYTLFFKSIAVGLMLIGGAVVGGWIVQIVSGIFIAIGAGAATIGIKDEE